MDIRRDFLTIDAMFHFFLRVNLFFVRRGAKKYISLSHKKIMSADDFFAKTDLYYNTLTDEEQRSFIKNIKTKFDDLYYSIVVTDDISSVHEIIVFKERYLLDKYHLFKKKNYFIHYMSKRICDAILSVSADTVIYGGFIRDNLLHDHMANNFYEKYQTFEDYNNPKIDKTTMFRTLVPQDIDVLFHRRRDYEILCLALKALGFEVIMDYDMRPYKGAEDDITTERFKVKIYSNMELQQLRANVRLQDMEFLKTYVSMDVTISGIYRPLTRDFTCNSLRMNSSGIITDTPFFFESVDSMIELQRLKVESVIKIKDQISRMEAYCSLSHNMLNVPDLHRIVKMFDKGWRMMLDTKIKFSQIIDSVEDCCSICREDCIEIANVPGVHRLYNGVKFECCSAVFHPLCLMKTLTTTSYSTSVVHISDNVIKYKCIQCAQECIDRIIIEPMEKFLRYLNVAWNGDEEDEAETVN